MQNKVSDFVQNSHFDNFIDPINKSLTDNQLHSGTDTQTNSRVSIVLFLLQLQYIVIVLYCI